MRGMCAEKIRTVSQLGAEKIAFPPKPEGLTDGRTDISNYRVASLLKIINQNIQLCNKFGTCQK